MNLIHDIRAENTSINLALDAMKKLALDMRIGKFIDSYRIVQVFDFLHTSTLQCRYEKEEKCLYPALLEHEIPWTADTVNHLLSDHKQAHDLIKEIDRLFDEYLSGNTQIIESLSFNMLKYVELEKRHIKIVNEVVLPLCERIFDAEKFHSVTNEPNEKNVQATGKLKRIEYYQLLSMIYSENEVSIESV